MSIFAPAFTANLCLDDMRASSHKQDGLDTNIGWAMQLRDEVAVSRYQTWTRLHERHRDGTQPPPTIDELAESLLAYPVLHLNYRRQFVTTRHGRMGLAPLGVQAGDTVCVFEGSVTPFILRFGDEGQPATFIGEVYIHGLMSGEALDLEDQGLAKFEDVVIA